MFTFIHICLHLLTFAIFIYLYVYFGHVLLVFYMFDMCLHVFTCFLHVLHVFYMFFTCVAFRWHPLSIRFTPNRAHKEDESSKTSEMEPEPRWPEPNIIETINEATSVVKHVQ